MKLLSKIAIAGVALVLVGAMAQPVSASCAADYLMGTAVTAGSISTIYTPNHFVPFGPAYPLGGYASYNSALGALTEQAQGYWWQLGQGDPAPGLGIDSGTWGIENWAPAYDLGYAPFFYSTIVQGGWAQSPTAIDGCISDDGVVANECMCVLVTDEFDGVGYALLMGDSTNANGYADLSVPGVSQIPLAPVPGPSIVGSSRDGATNDVTLQVQVDGAAESISVVNSGCGCLGSMQFKVYSNTVMRNSAPPVSRDAGWVERSGPTPIAGAAMVTVDCGASDTDVYVSTSLVTDSGFETEISANSTRVECGPTVATPDDLQQLRPGRQTPNEPRRGRTR